MGFLPDIGMIVREFANDPGDLCSIPGRVIPKTHKMVKWSNPGKGVAPSPTPRYSTYGNGNLRVTRD